MCVCQALFYAFNESGTGLLGQRDLLRMLEAMLPSFSAQRSDNSHLLRILDQVMGLNLPPEPNKPAEKQPEEVVVTKKRDMFEVVSEAVRKTRKKFDKLVGFYRLQMDALIARHRKRSMKSFARMISRFYRDHRNKVTSRMISQWRLLCAP